MQLECIQCRARLVITDAQAANPKVKLKCPACQFVFPAVSARRVQPSAPVTAGKRPAATASSSSSSRTDSGRQSSSKHCANHPDQWAEKVCPDCQRGYCAACGTRVHLAVICPACETLCIRPDQLAERLARKVRRRTPLLAEIQTILRYPFSDLWTLIPLGAVYLLFGFGQAMAIFPANVFASVFANGILMAYCFHAVVRVSDGNLQLSMPEIRDFSDILDSAIIALATWLISWGPLMALSMAAGFGLISATTTAVTTGGGPLGPSLFIALLKVGLGLAWLIAYAPAAVTVAAISKSFVATMNPMNGLSTIMRMGETYWHAAMIFMVMQIGQLVICAPFARMYFIGNMLFAVTNCYLWLATGCLIGLAVDKKAEELGLD